MPDSMSSFALPTPPAATITSLVAPTVCSEPPDSRRTLPQRVPSIASETTCAPVSKVRFGSPSAGRR